MTRPNGGEATRLHGASDLSFRTWHVWFDGAWSWHWHLVCGGRTLAEGAELSYETACAKGLNMLRKVAPEAIDEGGGA